MNNTCKSALDEKLEIALDERNLAQTRFSRYPLDPNSEISKLYKNYLCSEFFETEMKIKYLMLLYRDSGIEIDLHTSANAEQNIYRQAIERTLYHSKSEEQFIDNLKKTPHEQIYADAIYIALNEMHELEKFYDIQKPINIDDKTLDEQMNILDHIYNKPILALKEILKLRKEKDIAPSFLTSLTNNIMNAFEYEYIMPNEHIIGLLEGNCEEEFRRDITISASSEKLESFKEKLRDSIGTLTELHEKAEKINLAMFYMNSGFMSPLKGIKYGDIKEFQHN